MGATIRLAAPADAAALLAIYAPFVLETPVTFETAVPSVEEFRGRIEKTLTHTPWLVCEAEGAVAGYAYATRYRGERAAYQWTVESTVYVDGAHRRRGIAACLYRNLSRCLRAQGFTQVVAGIALPNPASVRLHEGLGFRPVGIKRAVGYKLGAWHDVGWWQLSLGEPPARPEPPRPLPQVAPGMDWDPPEPG